MSGKRAATIIRCIEVMGVRESGVGVGGLLPFQLSVSDFSFRAALEEVVVKRNY